MDMRISSAPISCCSISCLKAPLYNCKVNRFDSSFFRMENGIVNDYPNFSELLPPWLNQQIGRINS